MIIALDGNFSLVRKSTAGTSPEGSKHDGLMFMPDDAVQEFVDAYNATDTASDSVSATYC